MKVICKINQTKYEFELEPENTICDIKYKIFFITSIPQFYQKITHNLKYVKDNMLIKELGDNIELDIMCRRY